MQQNERYLWFDLIRGLSALAVCAGHLRAVIFQDYQAAPAGWQAFYFATGLGHQSVMVFFVLSGFFVGGSVLKKAGQFEWTDYATARLSRLWTVLLPALAVTAIVDMLTNTLNPRAIHGGLFTTWNSGPRTDEFALDGRTWLANVLFLQTVTSPVFGTNRPLWSLANEFWYYLVFPLCGVAVGACGRSGIRGRIGAAGLAIVCLVWIPPGMRADFVIWLCGVGVWVIAARGLLRRRAAFVAIPGLLLFVLALVLSKRPSVLDAFVRSDLVIGAAFTVLAAGLASLSTKGAWPRPIAALARGTSELSYSLYLVHFPLVALIGATVYRESPLPAGGTGLVQYLGWFALLLVIGAAFWWLFERRTNDVRRFVAAGVRRLRPAASPVIPSTR